MSLRDKTISGVIWSGLGTLGSSAVGFIIMMILARYLTPEDFGVIEIIISLVAVSEVLVDCGFSQAIIREKTLSNKDLSTVFWMNIIMAILLYCLLYFSTPLISSFYSTTSDFERIIRTLSLKIIFDAISVTQIANCTRKMEFKTISVVTFVSVVVAGISSVLGILLDIGIWAIVIYYLMLSFCKMFLVTLKTQWIPNLCFDGAVIKRFFGFGGTVMAIQILDKTITSVESLSIGRVFSKVQLGLFSQARKFDAMVIQTMLGIVQKVCYPALAKVEGDERLKTAYKTIMQIAMWVITPMALFSLFNAENFMAVVFGAQWVDAAVFLRIFSVHSLIIPLFFISWNVFLVRGEMKLLFRITIVKQVCRVLVLFLTLRWGVIYVVFGITFVMLVSSLAYIYYSGELIGYSYKSIFKDNIGTVLCATISVSVSYLLGEVLAYTLPIIIIFILQFVCVIVLYCFLSLLFRNEAYIHIKQIVVNLLSKVF